MGGRLVDMMPSQSPPPQSSPSRGEEVAIDDRRRFKELWKELLYARLLVGAASGLAMTAALVLEAHPVLSAMATVLGFGLPASAARRGRYTFIVVGGSAVVAMIIAVAGTSVLRIHEIKTVHVLAGTAGAAIGLAEGLMERSVATIYCGLFGGALSGALHGLWINTTEDLSDVILLIAATPVAIHLGIGLSLALGRWIRDWPLRKAEGADPGPGEE